MGVGVIRIFTVDIAGSLNVGLFRSNPNPECPAPPQLFNRETSAGYGWRNGHMMNEIVASSAVAVSTPQFEDELNLQLCDIQPPSLCKVTQLNSERCLARQAYAKKERAEPLKVQKMISILTCRWISRRMRADLKWSAVSKAAWSLAHNDRLQLTYREDRII